MEKKVCRSCGESKLLSEFYENNNYRDGHLNVCKQCHNEKIKQNKIARQGMAVIKIVVPIKAKYEIEKRKIDVQKIILGLVS